MKSKTDYGSVGPFNRHEKAPSKEEGPPKCIRDCGDMNEYQDGPYTCAKCRLEDELKKKNAPKVKKSEETKEKKSGEIPIKGIDFEELYYGSITAPPLIKPPTFDIKFIKIHSLN